MKKQIILLLSTVFLFIILTSLFVHPSQKQDITGKIASSNAISMKSSSKLVRLFDEKKGEFKEEQGEDSPEKFYEYERLIRTRSDETFPSYSANYRMEALKKALHIRDMRRLKRRLMKTAGSGPSWTERGPANVSGRTRGLVVDSDDPTYNTWFAASVGGGVWKTTNAGQSWIMATPDIGNFAASAIVQSASDPDVFYVGTGEGFGNIDQIDGSGIWKSTDHGQTWQQLASTANFSFQNIMRLIIDPENENIVLAATNAGFNYNQGTPERPSIFRTTNGGQSWSKVYESDYDGVIEDLISDPFDFRFQYATLNGEGVIRSSDGGLTWSKNAGSFKGVGRMEIAVSFSDPSRLYISAEGGSSGSGSTLYISRDNGESWNAASESNGKPINWLGGQGWYDNTIAVNPFDENQVFVGGINIWRIDVNSDNSIKTTNITDGYGQYGGSSKGVHVDQHNIVLVPVNAQTNQFRMINCNDGGVSYSDNGGQTFTQTENGYNTSQFYGVDKKNGADEYIGGMQDNGTYKSPAGVSASAGTNWNGVWGGDGFETVWNYKDPSKILVASQYNGIGRSTNGGQSFGSSTNGLEDVGANKGAPFFTKLAKSKQDADLVFAMSTNAVWRSDDFGAHWDKISIDHFGGSSSFSEVKISLVNPQIVWAATYLNNGSAPFVSIDGGYTFESVQPAAGYILGRISGFETHPLAPNTAFALFSFAHSPKIMRTRDLGQTWRDISGFADSDTSTNGFPDVAVYSLVVMPFDTTIIWAGTGIGLFESTDNGGSWHYADNGLPPVAVYEMEIVNDQVVAATHGRGIWSITLPQLSGYEPPETALAPQLNSASFTGGDLVLKANLRSAYDSTQVRVNQMPVKTFYGISPADTTLTLSYEPDSTVKVTIRIYSYKNGLRYVSQPKKLISYSFKHPHFSYANDFENLPVNDFLGEGFQIARYFGFRTKAIHTDHPYKDQTGYYYILKQPIIVKSDSAFLKYDDIALVEPGEAGTVFGDPKFKDYVVVEGSKDGENWLPLADGYDARYDSLWLNAYTNGGYISNLWVSHSLDLLNTFSAQDTILIRFRLYSDQENNGWGWAIDNLQIQKIITALSANNPVVQKFTLAQNYPNPFNPSTTIRFTLDQNRKVNLKIFNVAGQRIKTIYNGKKLNATGEHRVVWDGTNEQGRAVASGTYFCLLKAGPKVAVRKMLLIH